MGGKVRDDDDSRDMVISLKIRQNDDIPTGYHKTIL